MLVLRPPGVDPPTCVEDALRIVDSVIHHNPILPGSERRRAAAVALCKSAEVASSILGVNYAQFFQYTYLINKGIWKVKFHATGWAISPVRAVVYVNKEVVAEAQQAPSPSRRRIADLLSLTTGLFLKTVVKTDRVRGATQGFNQVKVSQLVVEKQ